MANTIGWGKGTQNNTNGWGKYQNTIDAGSVYADSYAGETVLVGTSAAFSYSKSSFHQGEADPTPTITGTTGGTFSATPSGLSINTSTGTIDLDNSTIQSYTITYTISGVSANQTLAVTASPFIVNNHSMQFDGVSSYIDAGNDSSLEMTGNFTLSAWVNLNTMTGYRRIIGKANSDNSRANYGLGLFLGNRPGVIANATGSWFTNYSSNALNTGVWHHLVGIYDGSNFILYVNGSLDNSTSVSGFNIATAASATTGDSLLIGRIPSGAESFNGKIDEVAIWNTALSSDAVTEIYNATANNTGKVLDLNTDSGNYTSSANLQYWNRLGD